MSDKPDDFEKACRAFEDVGLARKDAWKAVSREEVRRGMLAALREMREPSEAQLGQISDRPTYRLAAEGIYQAMLDELIRQGEQQGPGAD